MLEKESMLEMELKLLKNLSLLIANAKDFNTALDICLTETCKTTGWSYGEAWVSSKDKDYIYITTSYYGEHGELRELYEEIKKFNFGPTTTTLPGYVWQTKQPLLVKEIASDSRFVRQDLVAKYNLKSALAIPIIINNDVIAVIIFFMSNTQRDEELANLVLALIPQLGVFFNQLHMNDRLRKTNRALKVLREVNQIITKETDESSLLNNICKIAVDTGGYRMALIALKQHDKHKSIKIITSAGFTGDYIKQLNDLSWAESHPKSSLSGKVIRTGKTHIIKDVSSDQDFLPWRDAALKEGFQSVISLPLIVNKDVIGVLNMYASEIDAFDTEEKILLEELANDVAYGIMFLHTKIEKEKIQEQLLQSQKMEAIGQLAAGVAHDFNNFLTAIMGYCNIIYDRLKDNQEVRYHIQQVIDASEKALTLVQSLLTFSRKQTVELSQLDINQLIINVSRLLKKLLTKHITFKTVLTDKQLMILGNKNQLEQLLMNLVSNANDAMTDGGSLTISTSSVEIDESFIKTHGFGKTGRFALITVEDTGTGMSEDIIKKIFEPFFTTKPIGKGTGLGLSVAYGMVKQHNGYIDVISEHGKGTTFYIYLPLIVE
jgi:signal transduction histidine kinase